MAAKKKDQKGGFEPSVRTFTTWTPALIRSAELQADGGNLRQAAALCDWLLGDDRVPGTLAARVQALLGLEPTFEASGDKRRSNRVVRALEVQEDWWAAYPETELAQLHTWGLLLGVTPARHGWIVSDDHGGRILPQPAFWHPQHLRLDQQSREWKIRVATAGGFDPGIEETLEPGDGTWLLHTPYGKNRPWSLGLWRGLARFVLLKYYAIQDWARASEKGSILAATSKSQQNGDPNPTTREQRQELAQDIYNRGKDGVVVLPDDFDLKLIEQTANQRNTYEAQIAMANEAIAVAVRGGNLSTVTKGGSLAAAEQQHETGDLAKLKFDAQSLTTTIHDQSLVWWAEFNFGDAKLAPWPVYPVEEEEDLKSKVESEEKAFTVVKQAEDLGFDVDRKAFLEEHKISWAKPGTKPAAPKPVAPAAPGTPAPAPGEESPAPPADAGAKQDVVDSEARAQASRLEELLKGFGRRLDGLWDASARAEERAQSGRDEFAREISSKIDQLVAADTALEESVREALERVQSRIPDTTGLAREIERLAEAHAQHEREFQKLRAQLTGPVSALASLLASGADTADNRGFLDGQAYAETAHDWAAKRTSEALAPDIEQLSSIILASTDADDLRAKLEQFLGEDFDPDELAELTARAMILADLAGRLAVRKDVPEFEN